MNYKRIFAMAVLLCSFAIGLQAQETPEFGYLLGGTNGKVKVSGFGAYTIGFSQYDGNLAVYNGGGGAVLLNQTVYFGLYGTGLSTRHKQSDFMITAPDNTLINYDNVVTTFGHGGFWIGYIHDSYKPIHFGASTKIGWGSIGLTHDYYEYNYDTYDSYLIVDDHVFVLTPQLEMEMNLLRWFKINASACYQIVSGVSSSYVDEFGVKQNFFENKDFSQPVFNLSFVFGGFGSRRN